MKNSKPFPCPDSPDWLRPGLLTARQHAACLALFPGQVAPLPLTVIDLPRLQTVLDLPGQEITRAYLDPLEQQQLATFTFAKRRLEWLGGRIAAKRAAMTYTAATPGPLPRFTDWRIDSAASGRPYLTDPCGTVAELPAISISHSHGLAGALAAHGASCGLDLQRVTAKVTAIRERFASSAEWAMIHAAPVLQGVDESALLTLLWSAKEALRKAIACHPLLGFSEITLTRVEGTLITGLAAHFSTPRLASPLPPVFLVLTDRFACAITFQDSAL